jgi:predicted transcriptional regulator of viral defense system
MSTQNISYTGSGVELVRRLAGEDDRIFTTVRARELAPAVGLSEGYLRQALHHLVRSGWLVRLRRGLYAISPTVPGISPAHEFEIAMALADPAAISHWSALHYHGLTEQVPRQVFVLTTTGSTIPRRRIVGGVPYRFVQVKPDRFFGVQQVWVGEARVTVTDIERSLLDGLAKPQYCGDFAEVRHAFEAQGNALDIERIIGYAPRLDAATAKRLGWMLENLGVDIARLEPLRVLPIKGYRRLDPTGPAKGRCNSRWMIQENLPGRVA